MPCRRHRTWHPPRHSIQTQGRHVVVLSIDVERYTEYITTHFNVLGQTRSGHPSSTFQTHQRMLKFRMLSLWLSVRSSVESVPYPPCANPLRYPLTHSCFSLYGSIIIMCQSTNVSLRYLNTLRLQAGSKGRRPQFHLLEKYIHKTVHTDTDRARFEFDWL